MKLVMRQELGRGWITTDGIGGEQQEIALSIDPAERENAGLLLGELGEYVARKRRLITAGQTYGYGFTHLRFRSPDADERRILGEVLVAQELDEPLAVHSGEWRYVDGARTAMQLRALDGEIMRRLRLPDGWLVPHRETVTAVCTRLERGMTDLYMERDEPAGEHDSGWTFLCEDDAHHDSDDFLQQAHLVDVVERFRFVVPYLGCIDGSAVRFAGDSIVLIAPGATKGALTNLPRWRGFAER